MPDHVKNSHLGRARVILSSEVTTQHAACMQPPPICKSPYSTGVRFKALIWLVVYNYWPIGLEFWKVLRGMHRCIVDGQVTWRDFPSKSAGNFNPPAACWSLKLCSACADLECQTIFGLHLSIQLTFRLRYEQSKGSRRYVYKPKLCAPISLHMVHSGWGLYAMPASCPGGLGTSLMLYWPTSQAAYRNFLLGFEAHVHVLSTFI